MLKRLVSVAAVAGLLTLASPWSTARAGSEITITWIGHAAFEVVSPGGTTLLIDPMITDSPTTPEAMKDLSRYKPDAILLTHSHFDHVGDTVQLAKDTGAKVIGVFDHLDSLDIAKEQCSAVIPAASSPSATSPCTSCPPCIPALPVAARSAT